MTIFDRFYKRYDAWYDRNMYAYLSEIEALKRVIPSRGEGLEIGVGTGRFAAALNIKRGIDPSLGMIRLARQRGIDARVGKGEKLPYQDCSFDYVAIIISLCFFNRPLQVLEQSYRVLKKNGNIITAIIDKDSFLGKFYRGRKSLFYKKAHFYNPQELRDMHKSTGFKRFSYYQTLFTFPDEMKKIDKPLKGFGKGGFVILQAQKTT